MITIKAFWQKVQTQLKANNPVILAMVMEKKGSAPRGVGAHMLILSDGATVDTIGGGPLEYLAIQEAKQNLKNGKSIVQTFSLNNATAGEYGMVCGGQLTVALYCLQQKDLVQVEKALTLINTKNKIVLSLSWQNENFDFKVYDLAESFALKEKLTKKSLLQMDTTNQSGQYLEIMKQSPRVYLFGGGYVAQEVAKLLPNLEFEYIVLEERSEFAKKELFPDAKRIVVVDYADFSKQVEIKNSDYVIVVTNGHTKDTLVLESLLKNPPAYIGVIGSRYKKIHVENYLAEKGFSEDLIKQIIMPIGLDIKAETPSEIAISIVAQLIQKRAQ